MGVQLAGWGSPAEGTRRALSASIDTEREVVVGSKVIAAVVLSVVLGACACGSPAHVDPPSASKTSMSPSASLASTVGGAVLHGVAIPSFDCRPNLTQGVGGATVEVPARDVTEFLLCPMSFPQHSRAVTLVADNVHFSALLGALTAPDMPRSTPICPMYADALQVILAKTRTRAVSARIPIDGCGHYQHVEVLMAAHAS